LSPLIRDPVAGFINQRQTTPVTMYDIAIGNMKRLRKTLPLQSLVEQQSRKKTDDQAAQHKYQREN